MEEKVRIIEVKTNKEKWVRIEMKDLCDGDKIRIFDNGIRKIDELGRDEWIVDGSPYQSAGRWTASIKTYMEG